MDFIYANLFVMLAVFGIAFGGFCAWLASLKGYSGKAWFLLGFLFSFIALLAIAGAPVATGQKSAGYFDRKICPNCKTDNAYFAQYCKQCKTKLQ